ncbi:hypothetical protein Tsp_03453 [Trichinella spiralis]|uniref:hypothetical protein n=1 Tax=Trichinella spiralis TaxID=6334 RepID=UPI0001EFCFB7|nr:hypothetical protein Tsp_03453 [Trichinella spiralis]
MNRKADVVVQQQNKRRFQRKPDKQHDLYSVWSITLCNSSKNVSPNDGTINVTAQLHLRNIFVVSPLHYLTFSKHTCISRSAEYVHANVKGGLITYCIALFGYFGASPQQIRCDCQTKNMMKPRTSIGKLTALRFLYSSSMTELLTETRQSETV